MARQIPLYRDDGSTQPYELTDLTFTLREDGVAIVEFATPENLNGLSPNKRMEMFVVLEHVRRCPDIKAVVWTGQGRAFSSGAQLRGSLDINVPEEVVKEYARRDMAPNMTTDNAFVRETRAFWDTNKPLVAAVNGLAVGGAANIALCNYFDVVFCSTEARFKWPFVDIGFTPELGSSLVLPAVVGPQLAKQFIFSADWYSAETMKGHGLVNDVFAPEELMPKALEFAAKVAAKPPAQIMLSKKLLNAHLRKDLDNALRMENETIFASIRDFDGASAFRKKASSTGKASKSKL